MFYKQLTYIIAILFFSGSVNFCQTNSQMPQKDSTYTLSIIGNDFNSGLNDFSDFLSLPFHADKNDWLKVAVAGGITAAAFLIDNPIRDMVKRNQSAFQNDFVKAGDYYGRGIAPLVLSAGLYTAGLAADDPGLRSTGRILFESLAAAGITVQLLKIIAGRSRPYKMNGNTFFKLFSVDNDFNSFPSGHTIVAFTTSTVLSEKIDNIYASIGLYGLACLTAYQRIYTDNHWFSDTLLAAALGVGIGHLFTSLQESRESGKHSSYKISFIPAIINGQSFFTALITF